MEDLEGWDGFPHSMYKMREGCYGSEKATQLLLAEPNRNEYILTIYGNSSGDKEMMALADNKNWV